MSTARRRRGPVRCEPYSPSLVRVRVATSHGEVELTCTKGERASIVAWAHEHLDRVHVDALPVEEYRERHWGNNYRWTAAASDLYARSRRTVRS